MPNTVIRLCACVALYCILPSSALAARPSVITFQDGGPRRIYAFVTGSNGSLKVNYWNGSVWSWADLDAPPNATAVKYPTAITYLTIPGRLLDPAPYRRIKVFAVQDGGSQHNRLVVNSWDGSQWQWSFLGGPELAGAPSAITYFNSSGQLCIWVFAPGITGHLITYHWNGFSWSWAEHGLPPTGIVANLHAITYTQGGNLRIDVFCAPVPNSSAKLSVRRFEGGTWSWRNQGGPDGPGAVSAITYIDRGEPRKIAAYMGDAVPNQWGFPGEPALAANYWDGSIWGWTTLANAFDAPSAITYSDDGTRKIYVFGLTQVYVPTENVNAHYLKVTHWNGSSWQSVSHGTIDDPLNSLGPPDAITYPDSSGAHRIYVFSIMRTVSFAFPWPQLGPPRLVIRYWNGSSWQWADQGAL
jgi:hypothetical protein